MNRGRSGGIEVRTEPIVRRDLVELVTASGNIRARRTVDISSEVSAKVAELLVDEGEDVVRGQLLLRLEPDQYRAAVSRNEASLAQARAGQTQQEANLLQAQRDLDRLLNLRARDSVLVSGLQVDDARHESRRSRGDTHLLPIRRCTMACIGRRSRGAALEDDLPCANGWTGSRASTSRKARPSSSAR